MFIEKCFKHYLVFYEKLFGVCNIGLISLNNAVISYSDEKYFKSFKSFNYSDELDKYIIGITRCIFLAEKHAFWTPSSIPGHPSIFGRCAENFH